jgi:hypothetical protein
MTDIPQSLPPWESSNMLEKYYVGTEEVALCHQWPRC